MLPTLVTSLRLLALAMRHHVDHLFRLIGCNTEARFQTHSLLPNAPDRCHANMALMPFLHLLLSLLSSSSSCIWTSQDQPIKARPISCHTDNIQQEFVRANADGTNSPLAHLTNILSVPTPPSAPSPDGLNQVLKACQNWRSRSRLQLTFIASIRHSHIQQWN